MVKVSNLKVLTIRRLVPVKPYFPYQPKKEIAAITTETDTSRSDEGIVVYGLVN